MSASDVQVSERISPEETLMATAFRIFAERGYRATRLDDVAWAAGMTKGAIYYYFDSKEDLLRRAVESRHRAIFGEIAASLEGAGAPASAKIRLVLRKVWQHWVDAGWGEAVRLMMGEVSRDFPALFRIWAEEGPVHGWSLIRSLVEEGRSTGEFRLDVDPEVAARLVVSGLMFQVALHVHMGVGELAPCDPDRIFDSSVEVFLHGLAPPRAVSGG